MSEDIYAKPDLTKKVRFQKGEKEDRDACDDIDNVRIYDNYWTEESTPRDKPQDNTEDKAQDNTEDKPQDNTTEDQQQTTSGNVSSEKKNLFKVSVVLLGLLCLLLVAVIVLVVLFILETNQLLVDNANLTNEREQLQTSFSEMKILNHNLTNERDQLQTRLSEMEILNHNLTNERDQQQTRLSEMEILNHNLTQNMSLLENERDRLNATNNNLTNTITELENQIDKLCCCDNWRRFGDSCYFKYTTRKSWPDSKKACEDNDAQLVSITSQEEQKFISSLSNYAWIGLTDEEKEGTWKWVDGSAYTIEYWKQGQPDNGGGGPREHCAHISVNNWNDLPCSNTLYFICEKTLK